MEGNQIKKDLEEPSPNPLANRQYEQSVYLYHTAVQMQEIMNLIKSQEAKKAQSSEERFLSHIRSLHSIENAADSTQHFTIKGLKKLKPIVILQALQLIAVLDLIVANVIKG